MSEKTLIYEFAEFRLDPAQRLLVRNGETVLLTPKVFDTLLLLVQNSGRVIEKDKLIRTLWADSFVEESNLSQNIFILRKALGDDHESKRFIETIPKTGYQFVAPVKQIDASVLENELPAETCTSPNSAELAKKSGGNSAQKKYWSQHSPFRGLQVFEPEDSWLFFGRDSDTEELLRRLNRFSVLAIIGNSGSGKSSLVRAGLIAALQQGRFQQEGPADRWRIALFRPSSSPFDYLAEVLPSQLAPELSLTEQSEFIADCRNKLPASEDALRNAITTLSNAANVTGEQVRQTRILLVADQFEELFTLTHNPKMRHKYIDVLMAASRLDCAIPAHLVITVRADFYSHCLEHAGLSRCLEANLYNVRQMTPPQLQESIEKRLAVASVSAESGLIDSLLEDVGSEPGNLALLEHALSQLWEKCGGFGGTLTYRAYVDIGRLSGALGRHADNIYHGLGDNEQKRLARRVFLELLHLGEGVHDTRRRVRKEDLYALGDPEEIDQLLALLASSRLITTGRESGQTFVEVSHEMLIREWGLLREWTRENREELQLERRLHQAALEWQALSREAAALLRGARLAQGEEWLPRHPDTHVLLREFLQASITARAEAERNEREARERELEQQLERQRQAEKLRLKRMAAAFLLFAVLLGVIFTWHYIATTVIARRDQMVQEELKKINELARSLAQARNQAAEVQKRSDDAQALLKKEHDEQVKKMSQDIEALQKIAGLYRTEAAQLKQQSDESQNALAEVKAKTNLANAEIEKLQREKQHLQDEIERHKAEGKTSKPQPPKEPSAPDADAGKTTGSSTGRLPQTANVPVVVDVAVFGNPGYTFATGLEKERFRIFEDDVEQQLTQFSAAHGPWSIGIVFDMSRHVDNPQLLRRVASTFIKTLGSDDEFFLVGIKDQPQVDQPFKQIKSFDERDDPLNVLASIKPKGRHALLDAVYSALGEMRNAKNARRAIVIFSVGWADRSYHKEGEIVSAIRKSDVQIYCISISEPNIVFRNSANVVFQNSAQSFVSEIAKQSGGHLFENVRPKELPDAATSIGVRLHSLYRLEYVSTNQGHDSKYRRIRVKFTPPPTSRNALLEYRRGYYAEPPEEKSPPFLRWPKLRVKKPLPKKAN